MCSCSAFISQSDKWFRANYFNCEQIKSSISHSSDDFDVEGCFDLVFFLLWPHNQQWGAACNFSKLSGVSDMTRYLTSINQIKLAKTTKRLENNVIHQQRRLNYNNNIKYSYNNDKNYNNDDDDDDGSNKQLKKKPQECEQKRDNLEISSSSRTFAAILTIQNNNNKRNQKQQQQ